MGFQLADQFPSLHLDFQERRLRMRCVPCLHCSQDFITDLLVAVLVFHCSLCLVLFAFVSFQKDDAFTQLSSLVPVWCWLANTSPGFPHSTSFSVFLRPPLCKKMTCTPQRARYLLAC